MPSASLPFRTKDQEKNKKKVKKISARYLLTNELDYGQWGVPP